jgi:transcriptional regulator with XRE-family HTH domain
MTQRTIAQALKHWREVRGISQRDLADKSGVGYASIARIETGRQDPTVSLFSRLAEALEISLADLVTEAKASRPARKRARGK